MNEAPKLELVVNNPDPRLDLVPSDSHPRLKLDWKGPDDKDWLSPLSRIPGTQFKARDKVMGRRWQVIEFACLGKLLGDVLLCPVPFIEDPKTWFWVDPLTFCTEWEFRGVTEVPDGTTTEEERK